MRFPKAHAGVKKLFIAELLQILSGILAVTSAIFIATTWSPLVIAGGTVAITAAGVAVAAFIIQMIGLHQGGKDADQFMIAFWIIIIAIVLNILVPILNQFVPGIGVVTSVLEAIARASAVIALLYTIFGIVNLADQLGDGVMVGRGRRLTMYVVILYAISIFLNLFPSFFKDPGNILAIIFSVFGIIAAVAEVVVYVLTVLYYASAVRMLRK